MLAVTGTAGAFVGALQEAFPGNGSRMRQTLAVVGPAGAGLAAFNTWQVRKPRNWTADLPTARTPKLPSRNQSHTAWEWRPRSRRSARASVSSPTGSLDCRAGAARERGVVAPGRARGRIRGTRRGRPSTCREGAGED